MLNIDSNNLKKWLALSFPYLVQLIWKIFSDSFLLIFTFPINDEYQTLILFLLNSTAILFGIRLLNEFKTQSTVISEMNNHICEDCKKSIIEIKN